jgi:hypothetical protein
MSHEAAMRRVGLLGQEVVPALKQYQPDRERAMRATVAEQACRRHPERPH